MIRAEGLVKTYGALRAVDGLSFEVRAGEILGLVGPNGAGKTTTLRCLTGIIPPTAGTIAIAGFDLAAQPIEAKKRLAFIPDEPKLFDHLTVRDHMLVSARLYGVTDGAARGAELLGQFGLTAKTHAFPSELSRGMKQKLMLAMGLLHRPGALVLDEPLTGLDPAAMRQFKDLFVRTAEEGTAVLLSSHMLHLVEEVCDRVLIVHGGRMRLTGTLEEIRAGLPGIEAGADLEAIFLKATADGHEGS